MNSLAIIIPYYKLTFFRECLASLAAQTDQRFTAYIGNDASPEDPENLLKEFEGKFTFVYKKFDENFGGISLTKQWDRCVQMAQGEEWFMILGDDDYLTTNVVEEFYKNFETSEIQSINVIKLNSVTIDRHNNILLQKKAEPKIKSAIEHFFDKYVDEGRSSLSEHIFRRSKYKQYGFADFPLGWHSDDLALLEFAEFKNILFLEKAKCFICISSESITGQPFNNINEKTRATKLFFDRLCVNLDKFTINEKRKLFDLIQWHEKTKNIKIYIPNKIYEYYNCYGFIKLLKLYF